MSNARTRNKNFLKATNNNSNTEQGQYRMWHIQCQNLRQSTLNHRVHKANTVQFSLNFQEIPFERRRQKCFSEIKYKLLLRTAKNIVYSYVHAS